MIPSAVTCRSLHACCILLSLRVYLPLQGIRLRKYFLDLPETGKTPIDCAFHRHKPCCTPTTQTRSNQITRHSRVPHSWRQRTVLQQFSRIRGATFVHLTWLMSRTGPAGAQVESLFRVKIPYLCTTSLSHSKLSTPQYFMARMWPLKWV